MADIVIFESGDQPVQVRLEGETVWLSQAQMGELFGTATDNIGLHLKNIYTDRNFEQLTTTEDFSVVRREGARQVKRQIKHYNHDAIISVGNRVSPSRATRFREWATGVLRQHQVDDNKRTGSFLFLWYLRLNQHLLARPVEWLINDHTLVALALLVAESKPNQKELMVRLVEHFVLLASEGEST